MADVGDMSGWRWVLIVDVDSVVIVLNIIIVIVISKFVILPRPWVQ